MPTPTEELFTAAKCICPKLAAIETGCKLQKKYQKNLIYYIMKYTSLIITIFF